MFAHQPYIFGVHDCFSFCIRWAFGRIPENLRYNDHATAHNVLAHHKVDTVSNLLDQYFQRRLIAHTGDIVQIHTVGFGGFGIWDGDKVLTIAHDGKIITTDEYLTVWAHNGRNSR